MAALTGAVERGLVEQWAAGVPECDFCGCTDAGCTPLLYCVCAGGPQLPALPAAATVRCQRCETVTSELEARRCLGCGAVLEVPSE